MVGKEQEQTKRQENAQLAELSRFLAYSPQIP